MSAHRQSLAWAKTFKELLDGFTEALGGENITPARRAIARTVATLQTELSVLGDRFAASGRGASADDLNQFLKISATVASLLESVGLDQSQPASQNPPAADGTRAKLESLLTSLVRARQEEEAQGVFRDADGNIITDPERLAIEQAIHDLKLKRDAIDNGTAPDSIDVAPSPSLVAPCEVAPVDPAAVPNVVCIRPARAAEAPPAPSIPASLVAEKSAAGGSEQIEAYKSSQDRSSGLLAIHGRECPGPTFPAQQRLIDPDHSERLEQTRLGKVAGVKRLET